MGASTSMSQYQHFIGLGAMAALIFTPQYQTSIGFGAMAASISTPQYQTPIGLGAMAAPTQHYYYINVDSATHVNNSQIAVANKLMPIDVSLTGNSSNPRYTALWLSGRWENFYYPTENGLTEAEFNQAIQRYKSLGFSMPWAVAATGSTAQPVFAGVWVPKQFVSPLCGRDIQIGLKSTDISNTGTTKVPVLIKQYGDAGDPRFAVIYQDCGGGFSGGHTRWHPGVGMDQFNDIYYGEISKDYWRLSSLTFSGDGKFSAVYNDDFVGGWGFDYGLSAARLANYSRDVLAGNWTFTHLQSTAVGDDIQYSFMAQQQFRPSDRDWYITTGATWGQTGITQQIDRKMEIFMIANQVRNAQVSISRGGVPLLERGYTWSEPSRPRTQISDRMLIGSVSKAFTAAAAVELIRQGKLNPNANPWTLLGYDSKQLADPRTSQMTVQQLIDHKAGYGCPQGSTYCAPDASANMARKVAMDIDGGIRAMTLQDMVQWMTRVNLTNAPGTKEVYSNFGYCFLSAVVQKAGGGATYWNVLQNTVLAPNGNLDVVVYATAKEAHVNESMKVEDGGIGLPSLQPLSNNLIADVYGGNDIVREATAGGGGLAASATTLTKFLKNHSGNGTLQFRSPPNAHAGSGTGGAAFQQNLFNGLDWAFTFNTNNFLQGSQFDTLYQDLSGIISSASGNDFKPGLRGV